ncbi:hypothetical protein KAI92_04920 [Candidatus Parcubacteria bacterium]|nr:hypothetical protein [Candidatus Parcubacteria bacterium]
MNLINKIIKKVNKLRYKKKLILPIKKKESILPLDVQKKIRIFAATVIRGSNNKDLTGYLIEIDWLTGKIKQKISIPATTLSKDFWSSRGGNRGGRGIWIHDKILYLATAVTIRKYDTDLKFIGEISNPKLAGIHDILIEDDGIWVTSTLHDLIIKIDFNGNTLYEWKGSESKILQKKLKFKSRKLNLKLDFPNNNYEKHFTQYCKEERLHLNSICKFNNSIYVYALLQNAFIKIYPKPEEIILKDDNLMSAHNCIFTKNGNIIINNTRKQNIRIYNFKTKKIIKNLKTNIFDTDKSNQFSSAGWQRGLCEIKNNVFLVGTSPATIFEVDIKNNIIGKIVTLDNDIKHCIHGLIASSNF